MELKSKSFKLDIESIMKQVKNLILTVKGIKDGQVNMMNGFQQQIQELKGIILKLTS